MRAKGGARDPGDADTRPDRAAALLDMDDAPASLSKRLPDGLKIKRGVNGVARAGMIEHELEACRGQLSGPGPPERDPGRREASQAREARRPLRADRFDPAGRPASSGFHRLDQRHGRADRSGRRFLKQTAVRVGEAYPLQPILEFRSASPTERLADIENVVKRQALIVQHDVVGAGNRDDEGDARGAQQRQQRIHVVLIGFGMIGVADIASHRQAEQLAAEMVLEPSPDDFLAVIEIFRTYEADDSVDEQRLEPPRDGIGARFHRLLVDAEMRFGG